jgi:hypothetical protein
MEGERFLSYILWVFVAAVLAFDAGKTVMEDTAIKIAIDRTDVTES